LQKQIDTSAVNLQSRIKTDDTTSLKKGKVTEKEFTYTSLGSWNKTKAINRIISFVKLVSDEDSKYFIPEKNRIAVFDDDGTLWPEKPTYFQIEFVFDRITQMSKLHPEWSKNKLYKTAINHDVDKLRKKYGIKGLNKLMATALTGITTDEYAKIVKNWLDTAKHVITGRLYKNMAFRPMKELIGFLQKNKFKIYIVSGGSVNFIRVWGEEVYGIPKANVLGSISRLIYSDTSGKPKLICMPEVLFTNDKENKVISMHQCIGQKPVIAVGNSDGDLPMLEWCNSNKFKNLPVIIHHTDSLREWAYDRDSRVGKLDKALDRAVRDKWLVVDMKIDWKNIF